MKYIKRVKSTEEFVDPKYESASLYANLETHTIMVYKAANKEFPLLILATSDMSQVYYKLTADEGISDIALPSDCKDHEMFVIFEKDLKFQLTVTIEGDEEQYIFDPDQCSTMELTKDIVEKESIMYLYIGKYLCFRKTE